ncbi:hypothetical protein AVEN_215400-1 [Araneus ventricosus]|uniref:Uncharacterized protein n=1 Tax=Araneus ventricosus TaxID=182803 RepID=A0A4Y2GNE3_ARAVE|nr:hypothetical protein AVEN_215400-1 [Araneus ventricosus]
MSCFRSLRSCSRKRTRPVLDTSSSLDVTGYDMLLRCASRVPTFEGFTKIFRNSFAAVARCSAAIELDSAPKACTLREDSLWLWVYVLRLSNVTLICY